MNIYEIHFNTTKLTFKGKTSELPTERQGNALGHHILLSTQQTTK